MKLSSDDRQTIYDHFKVPAHISNCASAIRWDLLYGPTWSRIPKGDITKYDGEQGHCLFDLRGDLDEVAEEGDTIEQTYTGVVAKTLRDYIDELPSESWFDTFAGCYEELEPQGELVEIETDAGDFIEKRIEPNWEDYIKLSHRDLVSILFGATIADEFK